MRDLVIAGLITGAYVVGRIQQFISDARDAMDKHRGGR